MSEPWLWSGEDWGRQLRAPGLPRRRFYVEDHFYKILVSLGLGAAVTFRATCLVRAGTTIPGQLRFTQRRRSPRGRGRRMLLIFCPRVKALPLEDVLVNHGTHRRATATMSAVAMKPKTSAAMAAFFELTIPRRSAMRTTPRSR